MRELIEQAKELKQALRNSQEEINNPVLVMGTLTALDFFIVNVEDKKM